MKNTKINITTLAINNTEYITILFNNALTRITSAVNDLVSEYVTMQEQNVETLKKYL